MYSGSTELEKHTSPNLDLLVNFVLSEYSQSLEVHEAGVDNRKDQISHQTWVEDESNRRLAYSIWVRVLFHPIIHEKLTSRKLLECMSTYHFRTRPRLLLELAHIPMPCTEEVWEADPSPGNERTGQETGTWIGSIPPLWSLVS